MSTGTPIRITLEQDQDYVFRVRFDDTALAPLLTDEPPPLGQDAGPSPARLLLTAIANCLAASLLFSLQKFRNQPGTLRATIEAGTERNTDGRWRIPRARVVLHLADPADDLQHLPRILEQFEQFCVVTQSVRDGIEVDVAVHDGTGALIHESGVTA